MSTSFGDRVQLRTAATCQYDAFHNYDFMLVKLFYFVIKKILHIFLANVQFASQ